MQSKPNFSLRCQFIATPQARRVFERVGETHEDTLRSRSSRGLMVLGPSGSGKTTTMREYMIRTFPNGYVPGKLRRVVRVDIPSSPTKKDMAMAMLQAFDDPFASAPSHNAQQKMTRVIKYLQDLKTEVLILDEAQHLVDHKRNTLYDAADWIKGLMNEVEIGVVLVGLKRAQNLLWANEQLRRRFCAVVDFERFLWTTQSGQEEFAMLVNSISKVLPVPVIKFTAGDMLLRLHYASFGLIDYLIKVVDRAVWAVQSGRAEGIDRDVLGAAFRDEVWADVPTERNPFSDDFDFKSLIGTREPFENFEAPTV